VVNCHLETWFLTIPGLVLLFCSAWMSYAANQSAGKTIVVVAAKLLLVGLIAFCALLALQGLFDGVKALQKKKYEDAAAGFITGAIGAFGVYKLQKIIATFVKEPNSRIQTKTNL
jgi:hypothetical protein